MLVLPRQFTTAKTKACSPKRVDLRHERKSHDFDVHRERKTVLSRSFTTAKEKASSTKCVNLRFTLFPHSTPHISVRLSTIVLRPQKEAMDV